MLRRPVPNRGAVKILMLAPEPFFQPRGTPFSILYRLRALSDLGHEVDLLSYPVGEDLELPGVTIVRSTRVLGIQSVPIGPSVRKLFLDVGLYWKARRLLSSGKYDVLHTHEEAGLFGDSLARKYKVPHLYDMHSQLSRQLSYYPFFRFFPFRRLFAWLERRTIRRANSMITISPDLLAVVKEIGPTCHPVLIENTLDGEDLGTWGDGANNRSASSRETGEAPVSEFDLRSRYDLPKDCIVVLYAGSFEPYQGLDLLLATARSVVKEHPGVRFVLVGGRPKEVERMRKIGANLGLAPYLVFTGQIQPSAVPAHLRGSDILVSPRSEGSNIPSKVYSYLKAGRAILATKSKAHTQVLKPEFSRLTEGTSSDFTRGMLELIRDPELRGRLGATGKKLADEKFTYESYLLATGRAYACLESQLGKK